MILAIISVVIKYVVNANYANINNNDNVFFFYFPLLLTHTKLSKTYTRPLLEVNEYFLLSTVKTPTTDNVINPRRVNVSSATKLYKSFNLK